MKTKFFLQCIFLFVPYLINAQSVFDSAEALIKREKWKEAGIILERVRYDSFLPEIRNHATYRKAFCYKQLKEFQKAQLEMESITYTGLSDSLSFKYRYETALCAYLSGNFNDAESHIIQINTWFNDSTRTRSVMFLEVLVLNELRQWDNAGKQLERLIISYSPEELKDSLHSIVLKMYERGNIPKLKKQKTARVLSFVPGLGQLYAGYFMDGASSFLLNLTFLGFGTYQVIEGFYLTGYFIGAGGLSKTFFGNMAYSEFLVEKHNYMKSRKFNDEVSGFLFQNVQFPFGSELKI